MLAIDAGRLYTPHQEIAPARLLVEDGKVVEVGHRDLVRIPDAAERIDCGPFTVTPGFIEPHIHGCGGVDVMEGSYDAVNAVSRILARHGTTSFLATTVSSPSDVLTSAITCLGSLRSKTLDGAQLLGIHLEGPFINRATRGTHKERNIVAPDPELFRSWIDASQSSIRLLTLAPELEGSDRIGTMASQYGVCVAMGHSYANWDEAWAASERGVRYAVHTFNAMRPFVPRDPGIVGAVLSDDRIFSEIIADGIHVHPAVVRLLARLKGRNRVVLVTDAVSATDMPDGEYVLGMDRVVVEHGVCRDSEGRLAGSTLTQEIALRNFIEWTGLALPDALLALTENPANALGLTGKGTIRPGADADFTVLDSDFHVMKTFVAGKLVFERK